MTGQDVERELLLIAEKLRSKTSDAMSKVDARQKTAIKAYKISLSMIEQSQKMVNMSFSQPPYGEKYYSLRENRVFRNSRKMYFSEYKTWYDNESDADRKEAFLVYAHAVQMAHSSFLDHRVEELELAKLSNSVEAIFECSIIIDTLTELLSEWDKWWQSVGGVNNA